ncbi:hypothetical protein F5J12DRAFT_850871 [Pisolithus orientalis]|uniref:uncharacterized protein n=1 Tax=Pisolithus orientalis TaxID=936130 RepID=UPI00222422D3|nr:uncharacterized protein F5J12DRAFT_850871 [Pisolithus orientalis]KAI5997618.1 hypothetical protein F5J12DRAFT_850871 [Pisolithus orientalis]
MTLGIDRRLRKARTAVRWRWGARNTDTELDGSSVCVDFGTFYLKLPYSRRSGCARRCLNDVRAAAIQGSMTIYEEKQRAIEEKLHDVIRWHYYEWGERSEGTKVILFLSFSTETMPEEIVYRRAMATMTTAATTGAQETMSMALDAKQWPCNARMAIRWIRGTVDMNDELDG